MLSGALKLSSKQAKLHRGIHLFTWIDFFLRERDGGWGWRGVKPGNPAGCLDPVYIFINIHCDCPS